MKTNIILFACVIFAFILIFVLETNKKEYDNDSNSSNISIQGNGNQISTNGDNIIIDGVGIHKRRTENIIISNGSVVVNGHGNNVVSTENPKNEVYIRGNDNSVIINDK